MTSAATTPGDGGNGYRRDANTATTVTPATALLLLLLQSW
jgi:hypothetical protein